MTEHQKPDGMPRRSFLRDGAIVAASVSPTLLTGLAPASAAVPAYDPQQRFIRLVGGGNGVVYAIQADGSLLWYRHLGWQTGTSSWASGSGRKIGSGWHEFQTVFGSTNGSLYGVRGDGTVHHYRYDLSDPLTGAGSLFSGGQIGTGFDRYPRLCGFDGAIYGQDTDGQLFWHQYSPSRRAWTATGMRVGRGFRGAVLQADASGVIYAYRYGVVFWHRHIGRGLWARGSGLRILGGLRDAGVNDGVWLTGQGVLYAIPPDPATSRQTGTILHHRLINYTTAGPDGRAVWLNGGSATKVGTGWTVQSRAALQGYPNTPSVLQGGTLLVAVSTGFPSVTASMVRLAPNAGAPQVVSAPMRVTGGVQSLPTGFIRVGCDWSDRIRLRIPADWQPGLYAARLDGPHRLHRYVPFIRPADEAHQPDRRAASDLHLQRLQHLGRTQPVLHRHVRAAPPLRASSLD